jgi:hypothetical protein
MGMWWDEYHCYVPTHQNFNMIHWKYLHFSIHFIKLKATLDKGPKSEDQWIQAIVLVKSFKLVPWPLDKGPKSEDQWIQAILLVKSFKLVPWPLDKGPKSEDQWIQAILLVKIFKLVPWPLDKGPRPKSGKFTLNLHGTYFGGEINWFGPKKWC